MPLNLTAKLARKSLPLQEDAAGEGGIEYSLVEQFDVNFSHILAVVQQLHANDHACNGPGLSRIRRKTLHFDLLESYALARDLMHKYLQSGYRGELQRTFRENDFDRLVRLMAIAEEQDVSLAGQQGSDDEVGRRTRRLAGWATGKRR